MYHKYSGKTVPSAIDDAVTKSEAAYQALRRAIVTGDIRGQAPLDEPDLLLTYGLGRTPAREALKRLAHEQLIVWGPHRTPYVRDIGVQELKPLYEARQFLEIPAARLAASLMSMQELAHLGSIVAEIDAAYTADEVYEAVQLDYSFHGSVADGSRNPFLARAVKALNESSLRLWYVGIERFPRRAEDNDHGEIVAALRTRDPDVAEAAVRKHVENSFQRQLILHGLVSANIGRLADIP